MSEAPTRPNPVNHPPSARARSGTATTFPRVSEVPESNQIVASYGTRGLTHPAPILGAQGSTRAVQRAREIKHRVAAQIAEGRDRVTYLGVDEVWRLSHTLRSVDVALGTRDIYLVGSALERPDCRNLACG